MNSLPHILVVDDDREILKLLSKFLEGQGFKTSSASCIAEMEAKLSTDPDLIVLDIMLPDGNGLEACASLRSRGNNTPVILLTASQEDIDRIVGLERGADDYMGKPFSPRELTARIRAVLRRSSEPKALPPADKATHFDGFTIDLADRSLKTPKGDYLTLTGAEFDILKVFVERPGRVLTRDQILDFSHGRSAGPFDRSVDVLISRIRKKLRDEGGSADLIKTVRNGGYHFTAKVLTNG